MNRFVKLHGGLVGTLLITAALWTSGHCPALAGPPRVLGVIYNHDCSQREYFLALIRGITTDYSPDVLELDFMRFPLDFPASVAREWTGREPPFAALA
jgi:hypothetical protein